MKTKIWLITTMLLLTGCAGIQFEEQQSNVLTNDVATANSALNNGRVDIAQKAISNMTIYVNKPKIPVTVYNVEGYAVLPDNYSNLKVIYYSDLAKNKSLVAELAKEKEQTAKDHEAAEEEKIQDQVVHDGLIKQVTALQKQITDYQKSIFYRSYIFIHSLSWIFAICSLFGVGGIIALCVFNPTMIPIVINISEHIIVWIFSLAYNIVSSIFIVLSNLIKQI